jgi:hypothetical protein
VPGVCVRFFFDDTTEAPLIARCRTGAGGDAISSIPRDGYRRGFLRFVVIDLAAPRRLGRALATAILAPDFSGRRLHMNIQQGVADLLFGLGR